MSIQRLLRALVGVLFALALVAVVSVQGAPAGSIIYVDADAVGNDDGSSWADAYPDLQDALAVAQEGDEIWVAQGVYYPAPDASDRTTTFELQPGVGLYGGFAGAEAQREQRDWETYITVLSGDLDRNDGTDPHHVVTDTVNITGANAYHVVTADGVTETAVLDGFFITAGRTDGDSPSRRNGAGMFSRDSSATLANLVFSGNHADSFGGGLYSSGHRATVSTLTNVTFTGNRAQSGGGMYNGVASAPVLTEVVFTANHAARDAGGMYNSGRLFADATLKNVTFTGNFAGHYGGGMYNREADPVLTNVIFTGNRADMRAGALHNYRSHATLTNVTISGNSADSQGGGVDNSLSSPTLVNAIVWGNSPDNLSNDEESSPNITYSNVGLTNGVYTGTGNINQDPLFVAPVVVSEVPTTAGNYRLQAASPALDAGTNDPVTVETDLDGNPRILDGTGDGNAVVDMGPYEALVHFLTIAREGQGWVTSDPGPIDCGPVCTGGFLAGTAVTLTATADPGWTFAGWTGAVVSADSPLGLVMDADKTLTATFTQDQYTLDVNIIGEGEVELEPDQDAYVFGQEVTLTADPAPDWTFVGWSGDIDSTENPVTLTIEDHTSVTATFTTPMDLSIFLPLVVRNH